MPPELPQALTFLACGMVWNGVRLFHGRRLLPVAAFAGVFVWLILCQLPMLPAGSHARIALGAVVVATYTFFIAFELRRERRKSLYSRTAAVVVPGVHAAMFLMPLVMQFILPERYAGEWISIFTLETMLYAVGTAFLVLLMVKDNDVSVYRNAASIDHLTGLLNRRAFLDAARGLSTRRGDRGEPVTMFMLDLDHFKMINDRFGHAIGDEALRTFAEVARTNMRENDIIGRLGGEEFAVIVPESIEFAARIAERLRAGFAEAGVTIGGHAIGATVSIGAATSCDPEADIHGLLARADAALYRAKNDGRNRVCIDDTLSPSRKTGMAAGEEAEPVRLAPAKARASRVKSARAEP